MKRVQVRTAPAAAPAPVKNAVAPAARPLPLADVRLTGGPLKRAQDLDAAYLLKLEPDRMLAYYRIRAGLSPRAPGYGGWDGGGRNLTGHIAGHYLSGISLMFAATGDTRFKERADYIVAELQTVQDKQGDGYLGALENGKENLSRLARGEIRSGGFDLNGLWSPWYVLHKTFAGLRDAYRHTGNRTALTVEAKFAGWVESVVAPLSDDPLQKMLATEFGGMNEVLADLYADTGERRWLTLSRAFEHRAVLDTLKRGDDRLAGLHGNTQVPKVLGSLERYVVAGDPADGAAARFFWERVAHHHSYATGGHGKDEYFGPPDHLADRVDGRTAESCNVYNMLKMTRTLFSLRPQIAYAEFHERALFNHVLASIDPDDGRTSYMVPVGRGVRQEYQRMFEDFTCCVGSGMESHALHGDGLYYESGDRLWVNLYAPSTARWSAAGVDLHMETTFPDGDSATLTLTLKAPRSFTLALRRPSWAGDGFSVTVNRQKVKTFPGPGAYVELKRTWKSGDSVALTLPKRLRLEPTPDNPRVAAILWGPLALAGDLGGSARGNRVARPSTPVLVTAERPVADWLKPVAGKPGAFQTIGRLADGSGAAQPVELIPFYRMHRRTYAIYWDLFTPPEWERRAAQIAAERDTQRRLDAATVGFVQPGEMQPERDFGFLQASDSAPVRIGERPGRRHAEWFSFEMPIDSAHPMALVVTYNTSERLRRAFDILVDDHKIGQQTIDAGGGPGSVARFFEVTYPIPDELVRGRQRIRIRFQAADRNGTASVFGLRTIRTDALPPTGDRR